MPVICARVNHGAVWWDGWVRHGLPGNLEKATEVAFLASVFLVAAYHDMSPPILALPAVIALIVLAVVYCAVPVGVAYVRALRGERNELRADTRFKLGNVYCFGTSVEIGHFESQLSPHAREPVVVERYYWPVGGLLWVLAQLIACGTFFLAVRKGMFLSWLWGFAIILFAPIITRLSGWLFHRLRPTYYRVTPGCVEILVGTLLNPAVRVVRNISLSSKHVVVRFDEGKIRIGDNKPGGPTDAIPMEGLASPMRLAAALGSAVISTGDALADRLPEGALLG